MKSSQFGPKIIIPLVPHEAVPEVSKGKVHSYKSEEHVPIESFVTTLID